MKAEPTAGRIILVTGSTGQVGAELLHSLRGAGRVIGLDRTAFDMESPQRMRAVVRELRPSLIVNAAAYTDVERAESDSARASRVNARAPAVLAEEAARLAVPLIHYSTDYVYDGEKAGAYVESDPTGPRNVYGRSKLAGDRAIQASGCQYLILRTSWVYGRHGRNFVRTMLRLGAQNEALRVVDDQFGAPTWARVIADMTAHIVAQSLVAEARDAYDPAWWAGKSGIYHLSGAGDTHWAEFARTVFAIRRIACRVDAIPASAYPTAARRPVNSRLSNDKLERCFGLRAPAWRASLQTFLASY